jgi:hypothetical protein
MENNLIKTTIKTEIMAIKWQFNLMLARTVRKEVNGRRGWESCLIFVVEILKTNT